MMMPFGLSDKVLGTIRHIFSRYPEIEKAILYGSRAKGNNRPGSDIDLTLIGEDLDYEILSIVHEELVESPIPHTVDLSLFHEIEHTALREHIERVGVIFYERGEAS